jgi:hypothetical protein
VLLALFTCSVGAYTVGTIEATLSPFLDTLGIQVELFQLKQYSGVEYVFPFLKNSLIKKKIKFSSENH